MNINTCDMLWKMVCRDVNHIGFVVHVIKQAKPPRLPFNWCYLCMPPGCCDTGGASGTSSSPIPQETQHDTLPEVSRVCLLLPSASKERGMSDEAYREHERQMRDRRTGTEIS